MAFDFVVDCACIKTKTSIGCMLQISNQGSTLPVATLRVRRENDRQLLR